MPSTALNLPLSMDELRKTLRRYGIIEAKVFGSYARGEQTSKSDLDLYIRCKAGTSLFDVYDLKAELEQQAGVSVDLVTKINPHFSEYIEPDFIKIEL